MSGRCRGPYTLKYRSETVGAPQTVRLAVFGYSAFNAERYVSGTSLVVGSGLVAPTF